MIKPLFTLLGLLALGACSSLALDNAARKDAQAPDDVVVQKQTEQERQTQEKTLHLKLVRQMLDQNSAYAALAHLDAFDKQWGASSESRLLRAEALRNTAQWAAARTLYQQQINTDTSGRAWEGLGKIASLEGQWQLAAMYFESSIKQNPLKAATYNDLGLCYLLLNKPADAKTALLKAIQLAPDSSNALANLALWGYTFNDITSARDVARQLKWSKATDEQVQRQAYLIRLQHLAGKVPTRDTLASNNNIPVTGARP